MPLRVHWSFPLGVLVFGGFAFAPGAWLGITALLLVHELGHALLVRRAGLANLGIDLTGLGGVCRFVDTATPRQRAAIAWGGVLAQLVVLLIALPVSLLFSPGSDFVADLLYSLTWTNTALVVINLVPFAPLDGAEAWKWFGHYREDRRRVSKWKAVGKAAAEELQPQTLRQAMDEAERRAK